jgi:hypothetical protein
MRSPTRKFGLADFMITIAALGAGLAWHRTYVDGMHSGYFRSAGIMRWSRDSQLASQWTPFLVWTTAAVLIFRLRAPRPPWRRLRRQPGLIACVSALAAVLYSLVVGLYKMMELYARLLQGSLATNVAMTLENTGLVVAAAWMSLLLSGRWVAEPSWIDRAGRICGVLWIGHFLFFRFITL